jgi:hypothetical protein
VQYRRIKSVFWQKTAHRRGFRRDSQYQGVSKSSRKRASGRGKKIEPAPFRTGSIFKVTGFRKWGYKLSALSRSAFKPSAVSSQLSAVSFQPSAFILQPSSFILFLFLLLHIHRRKLLEIASPEPAIVDAAGDIMIYNGELMVSRHKRAGVHFAHQLPAHVEQVDRSR